MNLNAKVALGFGMLLWVCAVGTLQAEPERPSIVSIQRENTEIVVKARVPAGIRRLTLEGRARLGPGAWEPRAVARLDGSGGTTSFRLRCSREIELLRLRGDADEPLPTSFYTGTNQFVGEASSSGGAPNSFVTDSRSGGPAAAPGVGTQPEPSRDVVESDIWQIRGQTLYFFNQYRGLQIIDITDPDAAVVTGTLRLPASGEQMYLLGADHMVLLARNGCYYNNGQESQLMIVRDDSGTPNIAATLPITGYVMESRMVGTALYVASQTYRRAPGTNIVYEWGTLISSFDLADPAAPVSRDTLWYAGYGNVVTATEHYLFVTSGDTWNPGRSFVQIIDISQPDGTMKQRGAVNPVGRVPDKFKIDYNADREVLTIISQIWNGQQLDSRLETFRLTRGDGPPPEKLGDLMLGISEQLHATRFDGDRVYVVTFHVQFRLDPLWVVDLSDPAHPAITGQLEIPGWSTYLQPMGNRLVALGIETNATKVSLFDVANPAEPQLLSRVQIGSGWSWTEANWDEQAVGVFPEANLILVPFQSWGETQMVQQVQLVDLFTDSLALRGVIDHQFQPRRATIRGDRILSISAQELLSVKFSNRDAPVVRGTTELAWPVDRVVIAGDYLVQIANGSHSWGWWGWSWRGWGQQTDPVLRVTHTSDPEQVLTSLKLSNLPVAGVTKKGDYLYVAQAPSMWYFPWIYNATVSLDDTNDTVSNDTPLVLTVIDLTALPQISIAGQVETKPDGNFFGGELQPLWPRPDVRVWVGSASRWWWRWPVWGPVVMDAAPARGVAWPWFWSGSGNLLLAFDVGDPTAPAFASKVDLTSSNGWSFNKAFAADGLVYGGHQTTDFVPGLETPWWTPGWTNIYVDEVTGETNVYIQSSGSWVQRSFLDVVDYADAEHPTVREPVNISGALQGISHNGALLYTTRTVSNPNPNTNEYGYIDWTWTQLLDALAYDGVSAHLVDSLELPNTWPQPLQIAGNNIFLGRSGYDYYSTNRNPNYLETWTVPNTGKFTQLGRVVLSEPANSLQNFPGMLVSQQNNNQLLLFDLADPANLKLIGRGAPLGCMWFDTARADGNTTQGLWVPLGGFGVADVPISE